MANQLLLIEDVHTLGRSGDVVHVKPGYARNFLVPKGLAVIASKHALRMQARLQEERNQKALLDKQHSEAIAASLDGVTVSTVVKVDHEGHMYGSVSAQDIVGLLASQANITLEKSDVVLKHAVKKLGNHQISIKLKEGVTSSINLEVISEDPRFNVVKEVPVASEAPEETV